MTKRTCCSQRKRRQRAPSCSRTTRHCRLRRPTTSPSSGRLRKSRTTKAAAPRKSARLSSTTRGTAPARSGSTSSSRPVTTPRRVRPTRRCSGKPSGSQRAAMPPSSSWDCPMRSRLRAWTAAPCACPRARSASSRALPQPTTAPSSCCPAARRSDAVD